MTTDEFASGTVDPRDLSILEALHSTPSRRYLSDRPIPDDVLWQILDAATRGPSGGNRQGWGWVVVTDDDLKQRITRHYRQGWEQAYGSRREEVLSAPVSDAGMSPATYRAAEHLAQHLHEAPVWVIPVLRNAAGSGNPRLGASVYGAVQQLQLAARAFGIGSTLTTFHVIGEDEIRSLLGLPDDALTMALIPLGYPARGRWVQPRRRPVQEVVHWNQWQQTRERP
ncbi:nitroreductase family protein [Kineosporia sp. J2-2]|uniref:Nitroreductase family protein n=1 Tax=Kineosporia corallincola TaxID=2835133 RepID=A0ABS5TAW1_9ACTN|nr:nitroreductase family protein [Kineosporia corallincola]MBT0768171.1 nitroreductase family protein [Kineosporia corallincola]